MNKLLSLISHPKSPRTYLFIIELKRGNDNFIKVGVEVFLSFKYASYRSHGYNVRELQKFQFACYEDAVSAIREFHKFHSDFTYTPDHIFPDKEYCYNISLLQCIHYSELTYDAEEIKEEKEQDFTPISDLENKVKLLITEENMPGNQIATALNISESKVSRIKKKLGL